MEDGIFYFLLKGEIPDPTEKPQNKKDTTTNKQNKETLGGENSQTRTKDFSAVFGKILRGICGEYPKHRQRVQLVQSRPETTTFYNGSPPRLSKGEKMENAARQSAEESGSTITETSASSHLTAESTAEDYVNKDTEKFKYIEGKDGRKQDINDVGNKKGFKHNAKDSANTITFNGSPENFDIEQGDVIGQNVDENGAYMRKGADDDDVDLKDYVIIEFMDTDTEEEDEDESLIDIILSELSLDRHMIADEIRHFIAGAISGSMSVAAAQPFVNLKFKFQAMSRATSHIHDEPNLPHKTLFQQAKIMYAAKGYQAFWKHHKMAQIAGMVQGVTLFVTYEKVRPMLQLSPVIQNFDLREFMAGATGGVASALVLYPLLNVLTLRIARRRALKQLGDSALNLPKCVGIRGLYRGATPSVCHLGILYGFKFMFFTNLCDRIMTMTDFEDDQLEAVKAAYAGAISGLMTTSLIHPVNMVRTRLEFTGLQRQQYRFESTCRRFFQCVSTVVRREGFTGLYKGMVPNLLRSAVLSAVQFPVYYEVKHWL